MRVEPTTCGPPGAEETWGRRWRARRRGALASSGRGAGREGLRRSLDSRRERVRDVGERAIATAPSGAAAEPQRGLGP